MTLAIGTVLSGRYEIVEKIGTGGMAAVYRANDLKLDRSVTVKVLKEEYTEDGDFKERFKIEAKAAAKLSHPNIVNVYDVGEDSGVYYIVMEYVHGDTLKQVILNSAPLDNIATLSVAIQMASALSHAHKNGVIHRDIKPHNILVSVDGTIKITDFGIARASDVTTATTVSNALGSVYYLSPEQARGGYVDYKSDIYSLGITMYEMITGKVPYDGETSVAIALKHLNDTLPDIRKFNPNASEVLQKIIKKATEKKKDDRYANVDLLCSDLKKALSEESQGYKKEKTENVKTEEHVTLSEASVAASTLGVSLAAQKGVEETENNQEIKLELANVRKDVELPEASVGFDMYSKKLKISKDNDNYETDYYKERKKTSAKDTRQNGKNKLSEKSGSDNKMRRNYEESEDEYYKAKEKQVTIAAIITALAIIAVISIFGAKMLGFGSVLGVSAKTNDMPSIIGYTVSEAEKKVKKMEITINPSAEEYSSEYEEGIIMYQEIEEGTSVSKGDVVNVTLSLGSKTFAMPDVVYSTLEEAIKVIKNYGGSEPSVEYVFDDSVPAGVVMEQIPPSKNQINSGSKITITVSKGPETKNVTVPNLLGMKLGDAQKLITEKGLLIGKVTEDNTADGNKDEVIKQSLPENTEVARDTKIDFVVVGSKIGEPNEEPDNGANEKPSQENPSQGESAQGGKSTKSFTISAPSSFVDENSISVKVLKIVNGNTVDVVYNETKSINDFPFSITLSGEGQAEVQLYIDNVYQWSQNADFSSGGN